MKWLNNPEMQINIPGVNAEAGLDLYDGDMEIFLFALESFVSNTTMEMEKFRNVTQESLSQCAITAHGLKSTSAAIGAEDLSEKFRILETAAKAGDLPGVLSGNGELIKDTEILVNEIKNWLLVHSVH